MNVKDGPLVEVVVLSESKNKIVGCEGRVNSPEMWKVPRFTSFACSTFRKVRTNTQEADTPLIPLPG